MKTLIRDERLAGRSSEDLRTRKTHPAKMTLRNHSPVKQNLPSTLHPGFLPTEFSNLHLIRFNHIPFESIGDALEESNVDIATEFANLIVAQRSYEANARVITTFDQISQDTIALKQ
jgi:flagellar hook protein FlgE